MMSDSKAPGTKGSSPVAAKAGGKPLIGKSATAPIVPPSARKAIPPLVSKPGAVGEPVAFEPAPIPESAPEPEAKSAIEVFAEPAPTLAEKIESAVAPEAPEETPVADPVIEQTPAPALADAVTNAAPSFAAAPVADPVVSEPAKPEAVVSLKPDTAAAFKFAPALTRGFVDMATTFDAATPAATAQKVQAMFGGMNDRAKTAMEKSAKLGEELTELTKGNVEALVASGKVAAKGAETMAQEAAEYGKRNFESATAMFKSLASAKSPTELFQLQSQFAKSSFDGVVAEASKLSEAWVKLAGEVVQPISNRYAVAAEKLKAAAL